MSEQIDLEFTGPSPELFTVMSPRLAQEFIRARLREFDWRDDFPAWARENHAIIQAFVRECIRIRERRDRYSARTIVEYLRHHTAVSEPAGSEFKINDHATPDIARFVVTAWPSRFKGLFEFRRGEKP